ncbi:MAG: hypothetical protein LCI00_28690 [Chloroflexi bacterium]|nr:hypothetical protein [Chloroflexota bacterium]MCC6891525.1 hypothetical protein [Anaerolineae bacterium]
MPSLVDALPQSMQRLADATIFYYGADVGRLNLLPADAEFTMVYSPTGSEGWQSVRYSVFDNQKGYGVLERRSLDIDEVDYFERLLKTE